MSGVLASVDPSPRFRRWFAWYTKRMIRRSFHRVMITPAAEQTVRALGDHRGPVIVAATHVSWWDPLFALQMAETFMPGRTLCAPIEMAQYERFGVLRKLGLFGLDQHHPEALSRMIDHVQRRVAEEANLLFCITPQGEFSDVRRPIRLRPGVAAVAAALPGARVLAVCGEYTFWQDRRPELFWHARECTVEDQATTTTAWHRAIRSGMRTAAAELAERVIDRNESAFVETLGKRGASGSAVNPFYDAWLRLRGVGSRIEKTAPREGGA